MTMKPERRLSSLCPLPVLALGALVACADGAPNAATTPGSASGSGSLPTPTFNADSAYAHVVKQVAFGPRVPGTPGHAAQLAWMTEYLRARADTVVLQAFEHEASDGTLLRLSNVFVRFRPAETQRLLVLAHWDTRPTADNERNSEDRVKPIPGANDGASGTAVLLELANVLSRNSPPIGVDLLFVDGEDYGPGEPDMYLGAKHFATDLGGYKPLYGVLLDMIGDQNPVYRIEGNSQERAPEVIERVWRMADELGYGRTFVRQSGGYISDDHIPLNQAGIRTINIIDFDYGPGNAYWHTLEDDLDRTAPRGLGTVGTVLVHLIFRGG